MKKHVVLKPELRTPGGETVSIYVGDDWAGDVYLVYREGDILTGTIQIDTGKVEENHVDRVAEEVRTYIQHLCSALGVENSSVVMMYGDISSVVEMEPVDMVDEEDALLMDVDEIEDDAGVDEVEEGMSLYGDEEDEQFVFDKDLEEIEDQDIYHLSVVYKKGEHTKYHLHDDDHHTIGVVSVDEIKENVSGRVEFWDEPNEDATNEVAQMLARTFGTGDTERLSFTMNFQDQHLGDMHLERHDLY